MSNTGRYNKKQVWNEFGLCFKVDLDNCGFNLVAENFLNCGSNHNFGKNFLNSSCQSNK